VYTVACEEREVGWERFVEFMLNKVFTNAGLGMISCSVKDLSLRPQGAGEERVFTFLHRCGNYN
jgi:hypothetical protein